MSDAEPEAVGDGAPGGSSPSLGPNEGADDELGGQGEWPDPDTPPSDAAPGSDPQRRAEIEEKRDPSP